MLAFIHHMNINTLTTPEHSNSNSRICIAQTGILYMGLCVLIPAKSNIWVVVFVHGIGFGRIEEGS